MCKDSLVDKYGSIRVCDDSDCPSVDYCSFDFTETSPPCPPLKALIGLNVLYLSSTYVSIQGSSVPPRLCIYCIVSTTVTVTLSSCSHCELLRCKSSAGRISWFILHIFLFFNAEENTTIWHLPCSRHTGTYGTSIEGPACTEFIHCQTCTFSGLNVNAAPDGNKAGNKVNTAFNASPIRNAEARI